MAELTDKEIQAYIWFELVNAEKHNDFMNWLIENFDIKQKAVNNIVVQPDVIKSVCQRCNVVMEGATYKGYKMCHICREWQTVL